MLDDNYGSLTRGVCGSSAAGKGIGRYVCISPEFDSAAPLSASPPVREVAFPRHVRRTPLVFGATVFVYVSLVSRRLPGTGPPPLRKLGKTPPRPRRRCGM